MGSQMGSSNRFAGVIDRYRPDLKPYEELYKHLHSNPELSEQEGETAALITKHMKAISADFDIRTNIGGHGQIAILKNGPGGTIMLRADIDGLPVLEKTGLPFASKKTMLDTDGITKPVMHACGHDFHITSLLAAAETLVAGRESWSGTIIFLFQPGEERAAGAQYMVNDGLYSKHGCPIPDVILGQHVFPLKAGHTATRPGPFMSAADSFKITVYGSGGHGSLPHMTVDPVVLASHIVVRLQTIISREIPPNEIAVLTVGAIEGGNTENIISDFAVLKVNIRSVSQKWRAKLLAALERIVKAECLAGNSPKPPLIEPTTSYPLTENDSGATERISSAFSEHFGEQHDPAFKDILGSEDFGILGSAVNRPYCFWFFGGHDAGVIDDLVEKDQAHKIPTNHSALFAPIIQPTLTTGVDAMVVAALAYVGK